MSNRRSNLGSYQDQSIELKEKYDGNLEAYKEDLREEGRQEVYEKWREDTKKRESVEPLVTICHVVIGGLIGATAMYVVPRVFPFIESNFPQAAEFIKQNLPVKKNEAMLEEEEEDRPEDDDDNEDGANPV